MSKWQKNNLMFSYFAKQRQKESTETKKHEQETDSLRPTCSSSAYQSPEIDCAKERMNFYRPFIASNDIAKILPPMSINFIR